MKNISIPGDKPKQDLKHASSAFYALDYPDDLYKKGIPSILKEIGTLRLLLADSKSYSSRKPMRSAITASPKNCETAAKTLQKQTYINVLGILGRSRFSNNLQLIELNRKPYVQSSVDANHKIFLLSINCLHTTINICFLY